MTLERVCSAVKDFDYEALCGTSIYPPSISTVQTRVQDTLGIKLNDKEQRFVLDRVQYCSGFGNLFSNWLREGGFGLSADLVQLLLGFVEKPTIIIWHNQQRRATAHLRKICEEAGYEVSIMQLSGKDDGRTLRHLVKFEVQFFWEAARSPAVPEGGRIPGPWEWDGRLPVPNKDRHGHALSMYKVARSQTVDVKTAWEIVKGLSPPNSGEANAKLRASEDALGAMQASLREPETLSLQYFYGEPLPNLEKACRSLEVGCVWTGDQKAKQEMKREFNLYGMRPDIILLLETTENFSDGRFFEKRVLPHGSIGRMRDEGTREIGQWIQELDLMRRALAWKVLEARESQTKKYRALQTRKRDPFLMTAKSARKALRQAQKGERACDNICAPIFG